MKPCLLGLIYFFSPLTLVAGINSRLWLILCSYYLERLWSTSTLTLPQSEEIVTTKSHLFLLFLDIFILWFIFFLLFSLFLRRPILSFFISMRKASFLSLLIFWRRYKLQRNVWFTKVKFLSVYPLEETKKHNLGWKQISYSDFYIVHYIY